MKPGDKHFEDPFAQTKSDDFVLAMKFFALCVFIIAMWGAYFTFVYMSNFAPRTYSETELIAESFKTAHLLVGAVVGAVAVLFFRNWKFSLFLAIISGFFTSSILPYFYEYIWPIL